MVSDSHVRLVSELGCFILRTHELAWFALQRCVPEKIRRGWVLLRFGMFRERVSGVQDAEQ
jgi:hypothetical protein